MPFSDKNKRKEYAKQYKRKYIKKLKENPEEYKKYREKINNVVVCCWVCNMAKSFYFTYNEMLILGQTINKIVKDRLLSCPQS